MPTTTTNLGLSQPLGTDLPSQLRIAIGGNAALMDAYSLLTSVVTNAGNATVARGQAVIAAPSTTQTLPGLTANALVAVVASNTVTGATPVTISGTRIYGLGLSNAASFSLGTAGAAVILQSDGTNWYVVGGQQDTGWVALTLNGNVTSVAGSYGPAVRVQGDVARLKGMIQANVSASALYTVPGFATPVSSVFLGIVTTTNVASKTFNAKTAGMGSPLAAGDTIALDSITYSLS